MADMVVVWFCTEVSILGSVDGRHGDCVWFCTEVSILGSVDGDMVVVLVLHRGFNSREC